MIGSEKTARSMMLLIGIFVTALAIGAICGGRASPTADLRIVQQPETSISPPLDYHVWRVFPEDRKGFTVVVASVNPRHFNRQDMMALARELNRKYQEKAKLKVGLLDDENIARLFASGRAEYSTYETAERGRYYLDRNACREYVQFSTKRGRPRQKVKLDCDPQQQK